MAAGVVVKAGKRKLNVLMNGIQVGHLEKSSKSGLSFSYSSAWLDAPGARPISLSLPLLDNTYTGDTVYNFFDNLLPDNPLVRTRIQARFQVSSSEPFDLLASIGRDCIGAIQLIEGDIPPFSKQIQYEPLSEQQIENVLRGYHDAPLGMVEDSSEFRISLAGAQEKTAFLSYQGKWCRPLKDTPTSHIFKIPIGYLPHQQINLQDSCENEWLCAQIAEAYNLPVAKCEIQHFGDSKALVVERFDRRFASDGTWLMRLPQEDMCQALGISPNLKYQADGGPGITDIMQILLGAADPTHDREHFYRSQVLFWLLAAIDGHSKNFSLFIEPKGRYRLTPLYDILSVHPLLANRELPVQKIKMAMALKGKNNHYYWHRLQRHHFLESAKSSYYSVAAAELILDEMLEQLDCVIENVKARLPATFPSHIADPIFNGMQKARLRLL